MKTRSNMPLFVLECSDITKLTDGQIELLHCGDYLVKKTGKQRHAYKVTYKEDKKGICLTYHDASTVETVAYDYTGGHWVYNSTDKADLPINVEDASFKPIYCHPIAIKDDTLGEAMRLTCLIFNNDPTPFTLSTFNAFIDELAVKTNSLGKVMVSGAFAIGGAVIIASYITKITGTYFIVGLDASAGTSGNKSSATFSSVIPDGATFEDGVNKIN